MEDKLADTAPNKPLALTLWAAAITVAVVLSVLIGPAVVNCWNAGEDFGQCLQGNASDIGLPPSPSIADAMPAAVVEGDGTVAGQVLPASEEAPDGADDTIAATFGLLRAEPDGSVVIAGSGVPGTEVEVYSNGELLGSAQIESSGDWVLVPEQPIAPGGAEITLAEVGRDGQGKDAFVVVIDTDKTSEPLVVASMPGAISEVLQGMDQPAIAAPDTPPIEPSGQPSVVAVNLPQQAVVTPEEAGSTQVVGLLPPDSSMESFDLEAVEPVLSQPEVSGSVVNAPVIAVAAESPLTEEGSTVPGSEMQVGAEENVPELAAPQPEALSDPVMEPNLLATIDAIEIDGNRNFFAGAGPEAAIVRLYVDDEHIADTRVKGKRWLIEIDNVLTKAKQRVRIDVIEAGTMRVSSRAEVNFIVDLPDEAPVTIAGDMSETQSMEPATPLAVDTEASVEAVPSLVAIAVGDPDAERFASGKAIIRRGDNLWTIARRVYGEGIKYTMIFAANSDQIRNPHRIYPGQVFDLPQ